MIDSWTWTLSTTLTFVGLVVTVAIAVIGWVRSGCKNRKAEREAKKARETERQRFEARLKAANDTVAALRSQVAQLEEANRLYAAANPEDKVPWSDAKWSGKGSQFIVRNESNRKVVVTGVHAADPRTESLLRFTRPLPLTCEAGDTIEYTAVGTWDLGEPETIIEWHWDGEDSSRCSRRVNVKP